MYIYTHRCVCIYIYTSTRTQTCYIVDTSETVKDLLCAPWTTAPTWPGLVLPMRCSMKREIHRGCRGSWKQIRMVKVQQSMCKPVVKYLWISVNVGYLQVGNWFGQFASWDTLWTAWSGVSKRADGYGWLAPNGDSGQIAQWKAANSEAVPQSGHRGENKQLKKCLKESNLRHGPISS